MCSFGLEETEGFRLWGSPRVVQPSGAVWVSVESLPVFKFTAGMEGRVWTPAHLYSKSNIMIFSLNTTEIKINYCTFIFLHAAVVTLHVLCSVAKGNKHLQAWHCVTLFPSTAANAHLDGKEPSALRPCLCVMLSTTPLLCVPSAPPASLCQMDIPASVLWGQRDSTARKVAPVNPNVICYRCSRYI